MNKIPVWPTISYAYRFLFGQIGTVLAIAGGPAIALSGADYVTRSLAAAQAADGGDANGLERLVALLALAVFLIAPAIAAVGLTRIVLAEESRVSYPPFFTTVLRMAAANLRFFIGSAVLLFLAFAISYGAYRAAGVSIEAGVPVQPTAPVVAVGLISWVALLYVFVSMLRMGFLLSGVVSAEPKGGLKRAHALTQGNTWRILAIALALIVPILILTTAAAYAIMRSALGPDFAAGGITEEIFRKAQQAIVDRLASWELFNAVIFVLYSGLVYSGAAYAYRSAAAPPEEQNRLW
jgi:hypothetical protein